MQKFIRISLFTILPILGVVCTGCFFDDRAWTSVDEWYRIEPGDSFSLYKWQKLPAEKIRQVVSDRQLESEKLLEGVVAPELSSHTDWV